MNARDYIGKKVWVKIDRPFGSSHPKVPTLIYEADYGFIPDTISGDGEEIDVYVLGIKEPLQTFEGTCIAVIHRLDEDDDKLIVVAEGNDLNDAEIREMTYFQEKYHRSEIWR